MASEILGANVDRCSMLMYNHGTQTVFLGNDADVTPASGLPLPLQAGGTFIDEESVAAYYGITASGIGDLRIVEVT